MLQGHHHVDDWTHHPTGIIPATRQKLGWPIRFFSKLWYQPLTQQSMVTSLKGFSKILLHSGKHTKSYWNVSFSSLIYPLNMVIVHRFLHVYQAGYPMVPSPLPQLGAALWPGSHFTLLKASRQDWFYSNLDDKYPLVNIQKTMERSTIFNGKTHYFYGHFQ